MSNSLERLSTYIFPPNPGYKFVKREKISIPFKEFGINILEKTQTRLSYIYEVILRLIEMGSNNVSEISEILGIDFNIFKEIIAELARSDLISVSDMSLILSDKGKNALNQLKNVTIRRSQLNRLYLNAITGIFETCDSEYFSDRPSNGLYLTYDTNYDLSFLKSQFSKIEKIYAQSRQTESEDFDNKSENVLYRIIDIAYESIKFKDFYAFVYMNEDDLSLSFVFEEDPDETYALKMFQQTNKGLPNTLALFENDTKFIETHKNKVIDLDPTMLGNQNNLLVTIQNKLSGIIDEQEMESQYRSDRYLFDGEINDILNDLDYIKPQEIIISSPKMMTFLENKFIKDTLIQGLPNTKIKIYYNSSEYRINDQIKWIKSQTKGNKDNIQFFEVPQILKETIIIFSPSFVIRTNFEILPDEKLRNITKDISYISFNFNKIQEALKSLDRTSK
jgi:predicted transcriptional regulator